MYGSAGVALVRDSPMQRPLVSDAVENCEASRLYGH